ncbi:MAG TPA: hypothetical protein VGJ76_16090 [Pseudolabrys sp.]
MTDTTQSRQTRSRLSRILTSNPGTVLLIVAILVGVASYIIGLNIAYLDIAAARQVIQSLRGDNQKLQSQLAEHTAKEVELQTKLATTQATLEAIIPSENTYMVKPNQSIIVADGRLTIGLIGPPTNESININVNGKHQSAATGDVINIVLDPPTTCQVRVQSFDMFKAILAASCAGAKPQ